MMHLLSMLFWSSLLVCLALALQLIVQPNWRAIIRALRGEP